MAILFQNNVIEQLAVSPGATIYTVPSNAKNAQVIAVNCTNESATAETFTVHVVQNGGSLADTNIYVDGKGVAPGGTDLVPEITGRILMPSDFVIVFGSTASALNFSLDVKEIYG